MTDFAAALFQQLFQASEQDMTSGSGASSEAIYQRGNPYLRSLPYNDSLEEEAAREWMDIKTGFAELVILRNYSPALKFWCARLDK